jgi:DNA replication protein DnaC
MTSSYTQACLFERELEQEGDTLAGGGCMMSELTRLSLSLDRMPTPPAWFHETERVALTPERVRTTCSHCGSVLEPVCFSGYYVQRRCYCLEQARLVLPYDGGTGSASKRAALRAKADAGRCYTWLAPHSDSDLREKSFDGFDPERQPNAQPFAEARTACSRLANQVLLSSTMQGLALDNLILRGNFGTGKTHLAASICNTLVAAHIPCRFCATPDLFTAIYAASFEDKRSIIEEAAKTPMLVLDDLDKLHVKVETEGAYQKTMLFEILNLRYRQHLPTVITTNAVDALSTWLDGATISRLSERLTTLLMTGIDVRRKGGGA